MSAPAAVPRNMYPSWLAVENANMSFNSLLTSAIVPITNAVNPPMRARA